MVIKGIGHFCGYIQYEFLLGYEQGRKSARERQEELKKYKASEKHPYATANENTSL